MAILGGLRVGIYTLVLSVLAALFFLMHPREIMTGQRLQDLVEVSALAVVSILVVASLESSRKARDRAANLLDDSEEARARLNTIMDTAPVGVITCTPEGVLDYANRESEKIWGQPLLRLSTQDWQKYGVRDLEGNLVPPEKLGLARVLAGEPTYATDSLIERPNGTYVRVSSISTTVREESGRLLGAMTIMSDTTERARIEGERENALAALQESEQRIRTVVSNAPIIAFAIDRNGIFTFSEGKRLEAIGLKPGEVVGKNVRDVYRDIPEVLENIERALQGEITTWTGNVAGVAFQTQCTPMRDSRGQVYGLIGVAFDVTEQQRATEGLERSEERYRSLVTASAQIVWNTPADGIVEDLPQWRDYTGQTVEEVRGWGWLDVLHSDDRERTAKAWNESVETGRVFDTEYRLRGRDGAYRYFAVRGIPVKEPDGSLREWIGVCNDIDARKRAEMERARLLDEARARAEREAFINRIGQRQRASENPEDVQQLAVEALGRQLAPDRCYFVSLNIVNQTAEILHDWHRPDLPTLRGTYSLSDLTMDFEKFFEAGQTVVTRDLLENALVAANAPAFQEMGLMAGISVPFLEKGRLVGALTVATADQPRDWLPEEVSLVEAVAAQTRTTMALAHALQHDRNIAERLQDALKPSLPGDISGLDMDEYYQSALEEASIGGDFYDVFSVEKGCTALVIGDLSGKGLAAASQIATVRNMLRYALYRGQTLAAALEELNTVVSENELLNGFVTLFVSLFDSGASQLTYVSCGHEPMLLRRAKTGEIIELNSTGPVMGAFAGAEYQEKVVPLLSGDALILYTDGFSEAGRSRLDFLGTDGLIELIKKMSPHTITASRIVRRLVEGTEAHTQGNPHDDRALLVAVVRTPNEPAPN